VCFDGAHGGADPGAVGPLGLKESAVALNVVRIAGTLLMGRCRVIYTRNEDRFLSLTERANFANREGADIFVSVHCNAGPPGQGKGFEVWTSPGQTASDWLATDLFDEYGAEFPDKPKRMDMSDGDVDKESKFTVLMKTRMAAALFELEFIHTEEGEAWLADPENQRRAGEALARGITKYLKLDTKAVTPPPAAVAVVVPGEVVAERVELLEAAWMKRARAIAEADRVFRGEVHDLMMKGGAA
jgi:N-acetylmuramoyl-L-alanine amidase